MTDARKRALQRREALQRDLQKIEEFIQLAESAEGCPKNDPLLMRRALEAFPIDSRRPN